MSATEHHRITISLSSENKERIRQAARRQGMSINQFVLQAALQASNQEPIREQLSVSKIDYEHLCRLLDAPPRDLPALRALLSMKAAWDVK